jgi:hypothetical protein
LLWLLVGAMLLGACQTDTHAVFSPSPSPPHTQPTAAILQPVDVPSNTSLCIGSGPIDLYLATLTAAVPDVGAKDTAFWDQLLAQGAVAGAVSVYTANPSACSVELGATSNVKAITSLVVQFHDEGEADRAWQSGVFGLTPPPNGEVVNGVTRGTTTGLGLSSFVYSRPPVALACWRRSVFVALVVVSNLDTAAFKAATAAVDPRLN